MASGGGRPRDLAEGGLSGERGPRALVRRHSAELPRERLLLGNSPRDGRLWRLYAEVPCRLPSEQPDCLVSLHPDVVIDGSHSFQKPLESSRGKVEPKDVQ